MEFITNGNKIECIRKTTENNGDYHRKTVVVSFDANTEVIPPNIVACLTLDENIRLKSWMKERALLAEKLEDESLEETILDTLPALLIKAKESLDHIKELDFELFKKIKTNLRELDEKLNYFHSLTESETLKLNKMQETEILKEKLDNIKENL